MSEPIHLLDCQNEHDAHMHSAAEAAWGPAWDSATDVVDPQEGMTFWVDEYGEEHPRVRRWHAARGFALAVLEAGILWGVVLVILALVYFVFG